MNCGLSFVVLAVACAIGSTATAQERRAEPPPVTAPPGVIAPSSSPLVVARPGVITNPRWLRQARTDFPAGALSRGIPFGHVRLECIAGTDSLLTQCRILEETPAGEGFGDAALFGATKAIVEPRTVDGVPVASTVRFNVDFRLAE